MTNKERDIYTVSSYSLYCQLNMTPLGRCVFIAKSVLQVVIIAMLVIQSRGRNLPQSSPLIGDVEGNLHVYLNGMRSHLHY